MRLRLISCGGLRFAISEDRKANADHFRAKLSLICDDWGEEERGAVSAIGGNHHGGTLYCEKKRGSVGVIGKTEEVGRSGGLGH